MMRRSQEEVLLKCLDKDEASKVKREVYGACVTYKFGSNMEWLMCQIGYCWPTITADCFAYAKGCETYRMHGPFKRVLAKELYALAS